MSDCPMTYNKALGWYETPNHRAWPDPDSDQVYLVHRYPLQVGADPVAVAIRDPSLHDPERDLRLTMQRLERKLSE